MALLASASLARQLGSLFEDGSLAGLSDRQLLERFVGRRDEAAFAALVARHGPMVLGVCRQLVGDHQLAEDAFQAAFLVLARKARSLRDPDRLATWLYGVALRTARKARTNLARRRRLEQGDIMDIVLDDDARAATAPAAPPADQAVLDRDQAEVLHVEIDRLPEAFRSPVVLCYFEGLTLDQAAVRLGCPAGTLRSRLARAREKLRRALTRRGVVLSGAVLAAALDARSAAASVSPQLCDVTARTAIRFAARQTIVSTSATLAREVLRTMTIHKLRAAFTTLVFLAAFAAGAGYWFHSLDALARSSEGEPPGEPRAQTARTEQRPADSPRPADAMPPAAGRMYVVGRVLDPQDKPVPNATVNLSARRKLLFASAGSEGCFPAPAGHGASDASGRFRFDAARVSSAHHAQFGATALAPGYGVGWAELDPDEDQPSAEIRLMPEQVIEGRLFDVHGQPVPGAVVSVSAIWRTLAPTVLAQGRDIENHLEGPLLWWGRVHDGPGWPKPVTTDADGRFELHGIGRGVYARLGVFDPRFAPQTIEVATDAPAGVKTLKAALLPARTLTGRVTYADTGRPAAHAEVHVGAARRAGRSPGGRGPLPRGRGRRRRPVPGRRHAGRSHQCLGCRSRRATLPPRLRATGMAQERGRADRRPGVAPRRRAPRQGRRGGHRSARGGRHGLLPAVRPANRPLRRRRMGPDETRRLVRVRRRAAPWPSVGPGARRGLPAPGDQQRRGSTAGTGGAVGGCTRMPSSLTTPGRARRPRRSASRCGGAPR